MFLGPGTLIRFQRGYMDEVTKLPISTNQPLPGSERFLDPLDLPEPLDPPDSPDPPDHLDSRFRTRMKL